MADTYDVLTLIEGYRAINDVTAADSGTGPHDTRLAQVITALSRVLDETIGPVVNRTVTEYHDGGRSVIRPRKTPVSSVTTLKEWDGNSTVSTLTEDSWGTAGNASGFYLHQSDSYAHNCTIERRSSGTATSFASGPSKNVELVYVAGRAADTASVDARIKEAASAMLRRLWKRESGTWAQSSDIVATLQGEQGATGSPFFKAVQPMVSEYLHDEMKPPVVA